MANNVKFVKNSQGFIELMNSADCQAMLLAKAEAVASGSTSRSTHRDAEFTADVRPGKTRAHARAKSASTGGLWSALKEGVMTASLGDAR